MLGSRIGVLCLAAAACSFASIAQEVAAAATRTADNESLAIVATEQEAETPADLLLGDATLAARTFDDTADPSAVKAEEFATKILSLADAFPRRTRSGTRTALLGLAGIMMFFALHVIAQYVSYRSVDQDVVFKHDTGRLTFTGAGLVISFVLFAAGLAEAVIVPELVLDHSGEFPSSARGAKRASIGKRLALVSAIAIAFGWVIGVPQFVMGAATIGFLAGGTLNALGLTLLFSELKKRVDLAKKLLASDIRDELDVAEDAGMDPVIRNPLAEYFLGRQKGMKAFLADKGLPFAEGLLPTAAQAETGDEGKHFDVDAKQNGALSDTDTLGALVQQLQKLEQQQQKGATGDGSHRSLLNALIKAAQDFKKHPEILQQASELLQQLEMMAEGAAAARATANLMQPAEATTEEAESTEGDAR